MKIRILQTAIDDIAAARRFYDRQGEGLGDYFTDSIFSEVDSLVLYYGIHPIHFRYHRLLAKRFPYAIYYRLDGETVLVFRILDCRRNPNWVKRQLK